MGVLSRCAWPEKCNRHCFVGFVGDIQAVIMKVARQSRKPDVLEWKCRSLKTATVVTFLNCGQ